MRFLLYLSVCVAGTGAAPSQAQRAAAQDLEQRLEQVVDLPTAEQRRQAARSLAASLETRLDDLLTATANFGVFEPLPPGVSTHEVALRVESATELTSLALYVPARYDPTKPAPALLAAHGTGGNGDQMLPMWRAIADQTGMLVLAPSESKANDGYHFSQRERDVALASLRWLRRRANVDENAIFVTGISRGGHLAWDLALRHPDVFAGIAPMIGGPRITIQDGQNNLRYAENVARLPIRDLQGAQDDEALVWSVRLIFEKLAKFGANDARLVLHPDLGHWFDFEAVDWAEFFTTHRREPRPELVVRASARKREGRAFWVEVTEYAPSVDENFTPKVSEMKWAGMSAVERRTFLVAEAERRTSRLQIQRANVGKFSATSQGVRSFRVLLTRDDFDAKKDVVLSWNGDTVERRLRPSAHVLLEEFAEHFDRTFLPVAELEVR